MESSFDKPPANFSLSVQKSFAKLRKKLSKEMFLSKKTYFSQKFFSKCIIQFLQPWRIHLAKRRNNYCQSPEVTIEKLNFQRNWLSSKFSCGHVHFYFQNTAEKICQKSDKNILPKVPNYLYVFLIFFSQKYILFLKIFLCTFKIQL